MGNAVKILEETEEHIKVGGYGVVFGGVDLEGDTFTAETDFMMDLVPHKPVMYDHGMQKAVKHFIGEVTTVKDDMVGLWVEGQLDKHAEYAEAVRELIKRGVIGWSSGSVGHLVEREGKSLTRWPIVEFSLTPTPAEPRTIGVEEIKAWSHDPHMKELLKTLNMESEAMSDEAKVTEEVQEEIQDERPNVVPEVDYERIINGVTDNMKALFEAPAKPEPVGKKTVNLNLQHGHGDPDPTEDFYRWVATGESKIKKHTVMADLPIGPDGAMVKAAIQEGTDGEGGYLVPAGELGRIIAKRDEAALLPKLGANMFTTDRDVFNIPTEGTAMTKFEIVAEEGAISAAENEPTFGQAAVTLYNFKKLIKISEEIAEDYNSGLGMFLNDAIGRAWGITDNYYAQVGSGSSQPQGVFVGGTAGLTLDSASAIGAAEVPELMGKLKAAYRPGAAMLMARETVAYLAGLRDTSDWTFRTSPIATLEAGAQDLGIGYPVYGTEDTATIAASAKSMLFGNFALYGWVRNRSLKVRRLVELYAGNGQIGILANFRAGGAVLQAEAFQYASHPSA